jgi:predicted NAD-dependent protein-ADP-ribosyltransferase YbiA (DUF1768 family)
MTIRFSSKSDRYRDFSNLLLGSGEETIEEDSGKDYYWGTGADGTGQNKLGLLLMRLRAELREEAAA